VCKKSERACPTSNTTEKEIFILMIRHQESLDRRLCFQTVSNTKENGTNKLTNVMERDIKSGVTVASTKDIGLTTRPTEEAD